jgi:hypothetical protein
MHDRDLPTGIGDGAAVGSPHGEPSGIPELINAELVQLRIRVITLESVMIAVLAEGSDRQLRVVREMADYIAPRAGFTAHPLTVQAADHIADLIERVAHFRAACSSEVQQSPEAPING